MSAIVKQLAWLSASIAVLYSLLLAVSLAIYPPSRDQGPIDTGQAASSLYMTEPKYVFLDRSRLAPARARVIFVGASNTVVGFKLREVAPLLPGAEVDNLAVGGSNITQIAQVVDLVDEVQTDTARRQTTYVIGLWYGLFAENRVKWFTAERHAGDTDIDIERYRYGFYRRTDSGPRAVLPDADLALGVLAIHPYLVLDRVSREATERVRDLVFGTPPKRTDAERNATVLGEADKEAALKYWHGQMQLEHGIGDEQFQALDQLLEKILAQGSHVILVDLPIPQWHESRSPYYADYVARRDQLVSRLRNRPDFSYVEMKGLDDDLNFSDEVHPKPRVTPQWAQALEAPLHEALAETTPSTARAQP